MSDILPSSAIAAQDEKLSASPPSVASKQKHIEEDHTSSTTQKKQRTREEATDKKPTDSLEPTLQRVMVFSTQKK